MLTSTVVRQLVETNLLHFGSFFLGQPSSLNLPAVRNLPDLGSFFFVVDCFLLFVCLLFLFLAFLLVFFNALGSLLP